MAGALGDFVNPFIPNPNLANPSDNFIERGISSGIEKGMGKFGENLLHAGQLKAQSFAENLPQLAGLALVCFYVYIGYKVFFTQSTKGLEKIFPITMLYIIFKLFWKIVLHI
jgi:hypothetical protein